VGDHRLDFDPPGADERERFFEIERGRAVGGGEGDLLAPDPVQVDFGAVTRRRGGEELQDAAGRDAREGRLQGLGRARAQDDAVRQAAIVRFPQGLGHIFTRGQCMRAETPGGFETIRMDVRREDGPSTKDARRLNVQQAGGAASHHEDAQARRHPEAPPAAQDAAQRLDEHARIVGHRIGQVERPPLHVDGGQADELGETARVEIRAFQRLTRRVITAQAKRAAVARHVMGDADAVAHAEAGHPLAYFRNDARHLMAQHARRAFDPVPLHDVASADAARARLDEKLARSGAGLRHLLDPHVVVSVIHRRSHGFRHVNAS